MGSQENAREGKEWPQQQDKRCNIEDVIIYDNIKDVTEVKEVIHKNNWKIKLCQFMSVFHSSDVSLFPFFFHSPNKVCLRGKKILKDSFIFICFSMHYG